jgi:hypothetical protein
MSLTKFVTIKINSYLPFGSQAEHMYRDGALDKHADQCPICSKSVSPEFIYSALHPSNGNMEVVYRCTDKECSSFFVGYFERDAQIVGRNMFGYKLIRSAPKSFESREFSEEIMEVSSEFVEIYNQATEAENINLNKIAGVGYRKALEFLIKDYCTLDKTETEIEKIMNKQLSKVIEEDLQDPKITKFAKKAVWLGNDETHYVRKWQDKDISDLKVLIEIVVNLIDMNLKAKKLEESMNVSLPEK